MQHLSKEQSRTLKRDKIPSCGAEVVCLGCSSIIQIKNLNKLFWGVLLWVFFMLWMSVRLFE